MRKTKIKVLFLGLSMLCGSLAIAQEEDKKEEKKALAFKPLKFNITEDGSQWLRFILWNQVQLNSNNLDGDGDFGLTPNIRRSRFLALGQIAPKVFTYIHLGVNNVNTNTFGGSNGSDATQYFLHDAAIEYKFSDALALGGGLHYWNGGARLASWAGLTSLTYDIPNPLLFIPGVNRTDQFARHMGIYAKGKLGKFDYRLAWNAPGSTSAIEDVTTASENNAVYGSWRVLDEGKSIFAGNLKYNFIGSEGNLLPYVVGTYLGKKETLSASVGFYSHGNSVLNLVSDANPILAGDDAATIESKTELSSVFNYSFDINYDTPLGDNGGALTAYAAYMGYDYGTNGGTLGGATGNAIYGHLGYLIPGSKIQPYLAYQDRNWDDLGNSAGQDSGTTTNIGLNYYIAGHNLKLQLEYLVNSFDTGVDQSFIRFQTHIFF